MTPPHKRSSTQLLQEARADQQLRKRGSHESSTPCNTAGDMRLLLSVEQHLRAD